MTPSPITPHLMVDPAILALASQGSLPVADLLNAVEQVRAQAAPSSQIILLYQFWLAHHKSPLAYAIWFNLGVAHAEAGESHQAIDAYQKCIALQQQFMPARFNIGTALEKLGDAEAAIQAWQDILSDDALLVAGNAEIRQLTLNNLGRLLEIKRRFAEAEHYLKQSLVLNCQQPEVIHHWLHLRQKQCAWPLLADWPGHRPESALLAASGLSTLALTDDPAQQLAAARRFVASKMNATPIKLTQTESYRHERLRVAYLSGDFCLHPVALLMVELFELHDRQRFEIFGYCWSPNDGSALRQRVINSMDHFVRIDALDDEAAARRIQHDEIDILVDLQGLTSGARPNLLSYRPAPIQITYLGFPGTSGHPDLDYIIADDFVIAPEEVAHFSEKPLNLPRCFQPSDRQRAVAPVLTRGHYGLPEQGFVFCCFNNNYKITPEIFALWMRILEQVDGSSLWLLADNSWARKNLLAAAAQHGINPSRLIFTERVAPSIYLAQYPLADLFLDTFPFNAGTTANDALWQGLPLLTLSGRSFASRMAGSLLRALGLAELIVWNKEDYVATAIALAQSPERLRAIRSKLVAARQSSPVFDMTGFARDLEACFIDVFATLKGSKSALANGQKRFLHVGCGAQTQQGTLPIFNDGHWDEIRLDIDPAAKPDILASMTDLSPIGDGTLDAVYSSHNIEHLFPHEVPLALSEFRRVLRDDAFVVITCPDLQSVCALVAQNRLADTAYVSPAGPITPLDMLYGLGAAISQGHAGMAHKTGFTRDTLEAALKNAGFGRISVLAHPENFALWALATPKGLANDDWQQLVDHIFGSDTSLKP